MIDDLDCIYGMPKMKLEMDNNFSNDSDDNYN